jgi:hypothetical protein
MAQTVLFLLLVLILLIIVIHPASINARRERSI